MSNCWVLNASPVIVLARIGYVNLFQSLANEVVIPNAVVTEIKAGPVNDPARQWIMTTSIPIVEITNAPEILAWDLGAGETAVLSYTLNKTGWTAILDDGAARRCARSFAISLKGTLAIVVMAKKQGLIPSATEIMHQLINNGFRLDETIIRETLIQTVNETWT